MTWRLGSLFTGYCGLDMAAAVLGDITPVWHSDTKPAAVALLAHRFPGVPNLGDMTAIDWSAAPPVDVLTAGWPCQPHSLAGKQLGEADPRALWPHVARAVAVVRPRVFLGENVARIADNGELRRVVRTLAALGYVGAWWRVRASDIGAPHRRARVFVAAIDPARIDGLAVTPAATTGTSERLTLFPTPERKLQRSGADYSRVARPKSGGDDLTTAIVRLALLPAFTATDASRWGVYAAAVAHWERILGRPAPIPAHLSTRTGRWQIVPAFVEWMMGLPAGWVTAVPDLTRQPAGHRGAALSLLGDGVVPQQAAHAYRFLLTHLAGRLAAEVAA